MDQIILRARVSPVFYATVALTSACVCVFLLTAKTSAGVSKPIAIAVSFGCLAIFFALLAVLRYKSCVVLTPNELRVESPLASRRATYAKPAIVKVYWEQFQSGGLYASASWGLSIDVNDIGHVQVPGLLSTTARTSHRRADVVASWSDLPAYEFSPAGT